MAEIDIKATTIGEITLHATLDYKSGGYIDSVERQLLVKVRETTAIKNKSLVFE